MQILPTLSKHGWCFFPVLLQHYLTDTIYKNMQVRITEDLNCCWWLLFLLLLLSIYAWGRSRVEREKERKKNPLHCCDRGFHIKVVPEVRPLLVTCGRLQFTIMMTRNEWMSSFCKCKRFWSFPKISHAQRCIDLVAHVNRYGSPVFSNWSRLACFLGFVMSNFRRQHVY